MKWSIYWSLFYYVCDFSAFFYRHPESRYFSVQQKTTLSALFENYAKIHIRSFNKVYHVLVQVFKTSQSYQQVSKQGRPPRDSEKGAVRCG